MCHYIHVEWESCQFIVFIWSVASISPVLVLKVEINKNNRQFSNNIFGKFRGITSICKLETGSQPPIDLDVPLIFKFFG